jgi:hypothetical protein
MSRELAEYYVPVRITDISTASTERFVVPETSAVTAVRAVLYGTISGANAVLTIASGGVTIATLTVPFSGSAAGDVVSNDTLDFVVPKGAVISVATGGQSTGTQPVSVTLTLNRRYG